MSSSNLEASTLVDSFKETVSKHNLLCCLLMDFIPESGSAAGLELTVMRRAEMFREYLGLNCVLVTHACQPGIAAHLRSQIELGRLTAVNLVNLYDFVQNIDRSKVYDNLPDPYAIPEGWSCAARPECPGDFLLDEYGEVRRYRCYNPGDAVPSYINFIEDGTIVSRQVFDPLGFVSREESVESKSGRITEARFFRPDGTLALYEHYQSPRSKNGNTDVPAGAINLAGAEQVPDMLRVYAENGVNVVAEFKFKDELVAWWLLQLLHDPNTHYLVICDHALQYQRYFLELKRQRSDYPNVTVIQSTHNCHCTDPTDVLSSQLGDNYLFLEDERQLTELVVTQTHRQAEDITARFTGHSYLIDAIPNPLTELARPAGYLAPARSRHDLAVVGRLVHQKGLVYAIDAFALLLKSVPLARLHLFGDGPLLDELKAQAKALGIAPKVIFHGFSVNLRQVMEAFACLWCTSRHEGFTRVVQEALSVGTPVIAFDCRYGPREMIEDGVNGFLVPPGDIRALADKTVIFLKDHKLQRKMQKAAPRSVRRFTPEHIAARWAEVLLPVLEQDVNAAAAAAVAQTPAVGTDTGHLSEHAAQPKSAAKKPKASTKKKTTAGTASSKQAAAKKSADQKTVDKKTSGRKSATSPSAVSTAEDDSWQSTTLKQIT